MPENNAPTTSGGSQRFAPGNPGRPKGSRNRRSVEKESILAYFAAGRVERLQALYAEASPELRWWMEKFYMEMDYGKPHLAIDVVHRMEAIDEAEQRMRENVWTGSGVTEGESQRDDGNRLN